MAVIDASVYIALINAHEPFHQGSWAWFEAARAAQEPIAAPTILLAEVAAALSRGVGSPQLAQRVVQQIQESGIIALYAVNQPLAAQAAQIAAEHLIRGCDAVYVALAVQLGEELVTLDQQQLERSARVVRTHKPV